MRDKLGPDRILVTGSKWPALILSRKPPALLLQDKWQWLRQVTDDDIAFMNNFPFSLSVPSHGCIIVHAGLVPGLPLQDQDLMDLIEV